MGIHHASSVPDSIVYEGPPRAMQTLFTAVPVLNVSPFLMHAVRLRELSISVRNGDNLPAGYTARTEFNTKFRLGRLVGDIRNQGSWFVADHDPQSLPRTLQPYRSEGTTAFMWATLLVGAFNVRRSFRRKWTRRAAPLLGGGGALGWVGVYLTPQGLNPATEWISARYNFNLEWEEDFAYS